MKDYFRDGATRAMKLGNRGPLDLDGSGRLAPSILAAYWKHGFYVFEDVIVTEELADLRADLDRLLDGAPHARGASATRDGRPALDAHLARPCFRFAKPLSDPFGGTATTGGRYQIRMREHSPASPGEVLLHVTGIMQMLDAALRLYGHPQLLAVAEHINGPDFTPFTAGMWIKPPRSGAAVAWHQDGTTHWDNPDLDAGTHGFNFMTNLFDTNAVNALWIVPGTHNRGSIDLATLAADPGSDRLAGGVPLLCRAGDVAIVNRQVVHGSFPNTTDELRASLNFGFHRRASVIGHTGWADTAYDDAHILQRSRVVGVAINARHERFPHETPYVYQPVAAEADALALSNATRQSVLHNYNLLDIGI